MTSLSTMELLECARCGEHYDPDGVRNLCVCGGPLLVHYDLASAGKRIDPEVLRSRDLSSLWRYAELLPVRDEANIVSLGEGMTPLLPFRSLAAEYGMRTILTKDEGLNPTGTFKARGATTGVSRAHELGIDVLAMPTNGNAGGAWASYGARAGMRVVLCMPVDAPQLAVVEAAATGAEVFMVRGQISDAGAMISAAAANAGWYEAATLKEPYRVEGKKTMGYEIAEQMGWRLPDVIIYPTGGGVGLIGLYKAFQEMQELGWVTDAFPRLIAVQAAGCAPIVHAFDNDLPESQPWPDATTIAQGIRVPKALGDFLVLDAVRKTGGCCLAIEDEQTMKALRTVATLEGSFLCPEGAAAYAAIPILLERGLIGQHESVVVLNTGTGLKYPDLIQVSPPTVDVGSDIPVVSAVR